jgi:prepilin-type N-terminal cleavage/methylation domain-containing protein
MFPTTSRLCTPRRQKTKSRGGFTLIEIVAVIAIMGMVFAIGIPRLNRSQLRGLHAEAETIAASLEFARQRAIMTGVRHRVLIDLEAGGYRVEWLVNEVRAFAAINDAGAEMNPQQGQFDGDTSNGLGEPPIDFYPPTREERHYYPIPNRQLGAFTWLADSRYFVGLDCSSGWIEGGDVEISFDPDGTTEYSSLELADSDDNHVTLEIEPILDIVRRRSGGARS